MSARSLNKRGSQSSIQQPQPQQNDYQQVEPQQQEGPESFNQQQLIQKTKSYFDSVAVKLRKGRQLAEKATAAKQQIFNADILEGKYDIKERQWFAADQNMKNSRSRLANSSGQLKKDLENQLHMVQSRLLEDQKEKPGKMMSEEDHQKFMKKMEQKRKEMQQRRQEIAKQQQQQKMDEQKRQKQQMERKEQERRDKKKHELMEKLKWLSQQRKKQVSEYQQTQHALKQKISQKTLAQKIEKSYAYKQNEYLEGKKKKLAEIRAFHKPIDRNQLDSFSQKLDQLHQERQQARKNKQINNVPKSISYKSSFYKKIQHEQRKSGDTRHQQELTKLKEARDRLKRYADHVKNDYRPSIDEKKVEQLKFRSESLKHRSFSSGQKLTQTPRRIGLRYLEYNKINHKLLGPTDDIQVEREQDKKAKKIDYLAELREKNKNVHHMTAHGLLERLEKKNIPREEKAKCIIDFTQKMERKAKMREEIEKVGGTMSEQLDSLYLEAIQAKLSLLDLDN